MLLTLSLRSHIVQSAVNGCQRILLSFFCCCENSFDQLTVHCYYFSAMIKPKDSGILCFLKLFSGGISFLLWWAVVELSTCVKFYIHSSTLLLNMFLNNVDSLCLMNLGYKLVHFLLLHCCIIFSNSSCVNII